jgi:hypothetical protein
LSSGAGSVMADSGAGDVAGGVATIGTGGVGGADTRLACASNTVAHWPQRTQPSEILSWSATTLNKVPQAVQRVTRLIEGDCSGAFC